MGSEDDEKRLLRLGRLIGVVLKKPFATEKNVDTPSIHTRAYREWELKPPTEFENSGIKNPREYKALETLRTDPDVVSTLGWQPASVYDLAQTAHHERGFFAFLAVSFRKYLCKDKKLRAEIDRQLKAEKGAGFNPKNVTPEMVVASGSLAIGTWLVQAIPVLGIMGAPVIAGIVLIIYCVGIDAFCILVRPGFARDDPARSKVKKTRVRDMARAGEGTFPRRASEACERFSFCQTRPRVLAGQASHLSGSAGLGNWRGSWWEMREEQRNIRRRSAQGTRPSMD